MTTRDNLPYFNDAPEAWGLLVAIGILFVLLSDARRWAGRIWRGL